MANSPKLEIFSFSLNPVKKEEKTFKDFCKETLYAGDKEIPTNDTILFLDFFKKFIKEIDSPDFIQDLKKQKAFTAYDTQPIDEEEATINIHSEHYIIEGRIEGGRWGKVRNKSTVGNKLSREQVKKNDIILDTFYFFLYIPFDAEEGVLFIQGYSADTITDIFLEFIRGLFQKDKLYYKPTYQKYIPKEMRAKFYSESIVKKFVFTSKFLFNQFKKEHIGKKTEEFVVKIEASASNGLELDEGGNWLEVIKSTLFGTRKKARALSDFDGKVYLKNTRTNREVAYELTDDEKNIKPGIYLDDYINVQENGLPNFAQLKSFCFELLETVLQELNLKNAISES